MIGIFIYSIENGMFVFSSQPKAIGSEVLSDGLYKMRLRQLNERASFNFAKQKSLKHLMCYNINV